jgi:heptaprenyl diphosphate synthase
MEQHTDTKTRRLALLVAVACVLQIAESLLPHPIPGLRLGLANTLTLIALVTYGFGYALQITILRTILSSFIIGTFMAPGFILSFSAGIASTLVMGAVYWVVLSLPRTRLSIVSVSVVGAIAHNTVQLLLAYILLVRHPGIFIFYPWLVIGAVVTGWVTGIVAGNVCLRIRDAHAEEAGTVHATGDIGSFSPRDYAPGESVLHRTPSVVKVAAIVVLAIVVLVFTETRLYIGILIALLALGAVSGASPVYLLSRMRRYLFLLAVAFLLPVLFNDGAEVIVRIGAVRITREGILTGALYATRILLLMMASALWVRTTSPADMTHGVTKLLSPLRVFGIPVHDVAAVLSEAWLAIPTFWETVVDTFRVRNLKKLRGVRDFVPLLTDLIAALYLESAGADARVAGGGGSADRSTQHK